MTTTPRSTNQPQETAAKNSTELLIVFWLFVGIPLAWGVMQTLIKSMALFQ